MLAIWKVDMATCLWNKNQQKQAIETNNMGFQPTLPQVRKHKSV